MTIDITPIIEFLIVLIVGVLTTFIIPKIKQSLTKDQLANLNYWVNVAVQAVEEQARNGKIAKSEKLSKAMELVRAQGFKINDDELRALIEGSVYKLINQFKDENAGE